VSADPGMSGSNRWAGRPARRTPEIPSISWPCPGRLASTTRCVDVIRQLCVSRSSPASLPTRRVKQHEDDDSSGTHGMTARYAFGVASRRAAAGLTRVSKSGSALSESWHGRTYTRSCCRSCCIGRCKRGIPPSAHLLPNANRPRVSRWRPTNSPMAIGLAGASAAGSSSCRYSSVRVGARAGL
jgi:hypothetical protein